MAKSQPTVILGVNKAEILHRLPPKATGMIALQGDTDLQGLDLHTVAMSREKMEYRVDELHPINYIAAFRLTELALQVLVYQRPIKNNGESRLSGDNSIGIGGHVDRPDFVYNEDESLNFLASVQKSGTTEWVQEIMLARDGQPVEMPMLVYTDVIYDPSNEVGKTHLGLFGQFFFDEKTEIVGSEDQIVDPHWCNVEDLGNEKYRFENWSKFIVPLCNHIADLWKTDETFREHLKSLTKVPEPETLEPGSDSADSQ